MGTCFVFCITKTHLPSQIKKKKKRERKREEKINTERMRMNKLNILTDIWKSGKEGKLMHGVDRATEALSTLRRSYKVKGSQLASQNSGASLS